MRRAILSISIVLTAFLFAWSSSAQTSTTGSYGDFSPYSIFGVGTISKQGNAFNKGMGGVGIATRNRRFVNYLNPAAVTARDSLSFMADFSLASSNRIFSQGDRKSAYNTLNMYNFAMSFPIYKKSAMIVGIVPMSDVGYNVSSSYDDDKLISSSGIFEYDANGSGSIYQAFIGGGATFWNRLSLGLEGIYYFGNIKRSNSLSSTNTDHKQISMTTNATLRSITGKFGVQYEVPMRNELSLTMGATYKLGSKMRGYVDERRFASISSVVDTMAFYTDTIANMNSKPRFADEIGIGISLRKGENWAAEINYVRSGWASSNVDQITGMSNDSEARFSLSNSESFRAGFEFVPNRNDIRYYLKKCTYRVGVYHDKEYFKMAGEHINSTGITFGMTLPIFRLYNGVTLGVDLGQRGRNSGNIICERYANFSISFNISDIWFQQQRYN